MNGLEEIREYIKKFICEKGQVQKQIGEIEQKRTQLAQQRNEIKKANTDSAEVNELGRQITELGNQSQELQNKLDFKFHGVKAQINFSIDNLIAEGIRKIRILNGEIQELENKIANRKERNAKYEIQSQEFFARFGRMPELSERAKKENELQEKECNKNELEIVQLEGQARGIEDEIAVLANTKRQIKNGNWSFAVAEDEEAEEFRVEPLNVEEMEPVEEIYVEAFEPIEELYVEAFEPIEEIHVEEFVSTDDIINNEKIEEKVETVPIDAIEELAKAIVEEIVAEQTRKENLNKIQETPEEDEEESIIFEKEDGYENDNKSKVKIPLFGQKATISTIVIKIEDGELVYKAQMTDDEEIKIYPAKLSPENVLLRDKQNREECREILTNYAVSEYKIFDKMVINKIDPLICELLIECADKYNYNAQELIYNYAMSFSNMQEIDIENVPGIIYNLSYIETSALTKKEKSIINKICKYARRNSKIEIIEAFTGLRKIKYLFKKLFAVNNVKVLPEAKY